ncbi:hypothetical protein GOV05_00795 [Candidatus Woesearchaeota archaeon]|nr:hypothetical protein [Candidatus Woesearchaeota archaeon]
MALDDKKHWVSLVIGLLLTALGVIPLLSASGLIGFDLPGFIGGLIGSLVSLFVIAGAGVYLLINSFFEDHHIFWITLITSLIVIALGSIPILYEYGKIGFTIPYGLIIYQILFIVEGVLLIIAAFAMD